MTAEALPRIPYGQLLDVLERAMQALGLPDERAALCARLFAETTRDGVYSHGINRFPRFAAQLAAGTVDPRAEPVLQESLGALERWDGRQGPGNVNAWLAMDRALALADRNGIGCVALGNTSHWMRGGTYGWQAADRGFIGICWSNTMPNVPPWGGTDCRLGNNPFVMAVPRTAGPVVVDMAVSQFSYGALEQHDRAGLPLPVPGGFDDEGQPTTDPAILRRNGRVLPIGYWKGSGLSLLLDLVAAMLSGGNATAQIDTDPIQETALSQLFIAARPTFMGQVDDLAETAIAFMKSSNLLDANEPIRYPGERVLKVRHENERLGVPVQPEVWAQLLAAAGDGWPPRDRE